MNFRRLLKSKKLISPLIATLILVGVALAGGLLVYGLTFGSFGTLSARGQISIESMDLIKDTDGNMVFTITLKNSGNKPVAALDGTHPLNITKPAVGTLYYVDAGANLQPGHSVAVTLVSPTDLTATNYVIGNSYNVVVTARFSDGSLFSTTVSVICRGA